MCVNSNTSLCTHVTCRFASGAPTRCGTTCRAGGVQEKYKGKGTLKDCYIPFHPTTTVLLLFWSGFRDSIIQFFKKHENICPEISKPTFDKFLFTNDCGDLSVYNASSSFNSVIKDTVKKVNRKSKDMGFLKDVNRLPFQLSSQRKLINIKVREIQRGKDKDSGLDSLQQRDDTEELENNFAAHSARTGENYMSTYEMSNSTVGRVPTSEVIDLHQTHETLAVNLGVGDVYHGIFEMAKSDDFLSPFIDHEFSKDSVEKAKEGAAIATNSGLSAGHGSVAELVGLQDGGQGKTDDEIRDKVGNWLDGPQAQVILDLCVNKEGGGGGKKSRLRPFQKKALLECLAGEVRQAQGDGVGRTILLDAPCNGGKTLIVMFMALTYQLFMGVKNGGRYWVTVVIYLNVSVMLDQAQVREGWGGRGGEPSEGL